MLSLIPAYLLYPVTIIVSALISLYAVRKIIFITRHRNLFDKPDNVRKKHGGQIPSLGGIGVFVGYMVTAAFFMEHQWYFVMAASVILFFTGIYDDIMNMRPSKKLLAQAVATTIAVLFADIRIRSLHGFAGIEDLPYYISVSLTVFLGTFFINVFNFMDGIDGLACSLAILYTLFLGMLFAYAGEMSIAGISLSLMGATIGLLYFNIAPARIYMGDTGSMMLGFTIFTLSVLCAELLSSSTADLTLVVHNKSASFSILLSVLFLPIFDAIRVFSIRLSKGISPFNADRSHIHYYMLDAGFTHTGAVLTLLVANICIIGTTWALQDAGTIVSILCMTLIPSALTIWISIKRRKAVATKY